VLVSLTGADGRPAYEAIFAGVGVAELLLAFGTIVILRRLAPRKTPDDAAVRVEA
jgi:hypothetical protein